MPVVGQSAYPAPATGRQHIGEGYAYHSSLPLWSMQLRHLSKGPKSSSQSTVRGFAVGRSAAVRLGSQPQSPPHKFQRNSTSPQLHNLHPLHTNRARAAPRSLLQRHNTSPVQLQQLIERSASNLHIPTHPPGPSNRSAAWQYNRETSFKPPLRPIRPSQSGNESEAASLEGVVKTITLDNKATGYLVAKIKVTKMDVSAAWFLATFKFQVDLVDKVAPGEAPADKVRRNGIVTAVANHQQLLLGQQVRLQGHWSRHEKYGPQFQVEKVTHHKMSAKESAVAMLQAANLPGVGPKTASLLAQQFGSELESIMDSPEAAKMLLTVNGIGNKTAGRIKEAWDSTRGQREGAAFLQSLGLQGKLVQRIVSRHGSETKNAVSRDPFYALRNVKGATLRIAENVAKQLDAEWQVPARAILAIQDMLREAERSRGHTFVTWEQLQASALKHLNASGVSWHGNDLAGIAQLGASWGDIVAEVGEVTSPDVEDSMASESDIREVEVSLKAYLSARIAGVGPKRANMLVEKFGSGVFNLLNSQNAEQRLKESLKLRPYVARDIAKNWLANPQNRPAWSPSIPGIEVPPAAERTQKATAQLFSAGVKPEAWSGSVRCYLPEMYAAEVTVARELARLASRKAVPMRSRRNPRAVVDAWIKKNDLESEVQLSEGQKAAVRAASTAPILILTGGPGCGKTYTTATIVKLWSALGKQVRLAAPTGRASQRLQEMARLPSCTIHRLLQYKTASARHEGKDDEDELEGSYSFNASNPLPIEALLVDEAAMLDVKLAAALLQALPPACQLVLVGDVDQLPPVGPGTVLSAAIQSGVIPVIDLREIFRQAEKSGIVTAAHAVQRGEFPDLTKISPESLEVPGTRQMTSDAVWVKPEGSADGKALQSLVLKVLQNYIRPLGFNTATDVQVLAPLRRGNTGVETLNLQLQHLLNPGQERSDEISRHSYAKSGSPVFRVRDRVIQTINNYEREVFNGDPGFVIDVKPSDRSLTVEFPETDFSRIAAGHITKRVEYKASSLWELDMAWATTVHKSQGGECPVVVLMLSNAHRPLLTRRLLYTALTRAKQLVVVVAPEKAIRTAVSEVKADLRLSSLHQRLQAQAERLGVPQSMVQNFGRKREIESVEVACTPSDAVSPEIVAEIAAVPVENSLSHHQMPDSPSQHLTSRGSANRSAPKKSDLDALLLTQLAAPKKRLKPTPSQSLLQKHEPKSAAVTPASLNVTEQADAEEGLEIGAEGEETDTSTSQQMGHLEERLRTAYSLEDWEKEPAKATEASSSRFWEDTAALASISHELREKLQNQSSLSRNWKPQNSDWELTEPASNTKESGTKPSRAESLLEAFGGR